MIENKSLLPVTILLPGTEFPNNIIITANEGGRGPIPSDKLHKINSNYMVSPNYSVYASAIRNLVSYNQSRLCVKLGESAVYSSLNTSHLLVISTTEYNGKQYLTGFATVVFIPGEKLIQVDYLCSDLRLQNIGQNIMTYIKQLAIYFNSKIIIHSTRERYTQLFYIKQFFVYQGPFGRNLELYIWELNPDNMEDNYLIESFTTPFMAMANDRKIDSYKSSTPAKLLPEERNIFYFKRYTRSCPVGKGRKRTCKTKKRKNQTRK